MAAARLADCVITRRTTMEQRIQEAVKKFAAGLANEITAVIYDDLISDLQEQRATNKDLVSLDEKKKPRKMSTRKGVKSTRKATKRASAKTAKVKAKRTPAQLEKLTAKTLATITANPGLGSEAIAKIMRTTTKDLRPSILSLTADKAIRIKGERRATKYFPKGKKIKAKA
jgi:hypothetical protein